MKALDDVMDRVDGALADAAGGRPNKAVGEAIALAQAQMGQLRSLLGSFSNEPLKRERDEALGAKKVADARLQETLARAGKASQAHALERSALQAALGTAKATAEAALEVAAEEKGKIAVALGLDKQAVIEDIEEHALLQRGQLEAALAKEESPAPAEAEAVEPIHPVRREPRPRS